MGRPCIKPLFALMSLWVQLFCSKFSLVISWLHRWQYLIRLYVSFNPFDRCYDCCMISSVLNEFYYTHNNADTWQRMVILLVMVVDLIVLEG